MMSVIAIKPYRFLKNLLLKRLLCCNVTTIDIRPTKCVKEAIEACSQPLKFLLDWFLMPAMFKDLDNTVFFNDDINLVNADSVNVELFNDNMVLVSVVLENANIYDG